MTSEAEPTLAEVVRLAFEDRLGDLHTAMPATVESYSEEKQEVDVKPLLKLAYVNDDGSEGLDDIPVIQAVPVVWPRGGKFFFSFPLVRGDCVLLIFNERSIDEWSATSGKISVDPIDLRLHDLSDAVALPGLYPMTRILTEVNLGKDGVIGREKGVQIRITENDTVEITTKGSPVSVGGFVALATLVQAELDAIIGLLTGWAVVPQDGGLALQTAAIAQWGPVPPPTDVKSTNLKAD